MRAKIIGTHNSGITVVPGKHISNSHLVLDIIVIVHNPSIIVPLIIMVVDEVQDFVCVAISISIA
jgi:hypothetical protein